MLSAVGMGMGQEGSVRASMPPIGGQDAAAAAAGWMQGGWLDGSGQAMQALYQSIYEGLYEGLSAWVMPVTGILLGMGEGMALHINAAGVDVSNIGGELYAAATGLLSGEGVGKGGGDAGILARIFLGRDWSTECSLIVGALAHSRIGMAIIKPLYG